MAHNLGSSSIAEEGNTHNRPPLFNGTNYASWKNPMKYHIMSEGIEYWKVIIKGPNLPTKDNGEPKDELDYDDEDWKKAYVNARAMKIIYCALTMEERNRVNSCTNAKEMWERLRVTHEGTNQVRETKINMLLHDYEMFSMRDAETISSMFDRFAEITNGLGNLGKHMSDSEKVKKILRSLPKEWDSQVTVIMESKDLNTLEFNALVGSLINYEIILKTRGGRPKPKERTIALKASAPPNGESEVELEEEEKDDEEMALYAKNLRKFRKLMNSIRKELRGDDRRSGYNRKKEASNEACYKCGKSGHFARECRSSLSSLRPQNRNERYDRGDKEKKKEVLVATWSDEEDDDQSYEENNLALMARSTHSSGDENEVNSLTFDD